MMNGNPDLIDISGLEDAAVLAALFNEAKPLGFGHLQAQARGPAPMTIEEARAIIGQSIAARGGDDGWRVDYVHGRPIKVASRKTGVLDGAVLYDRDQGAGMCQRIIDRLRVMVQR